MPITIRKLCTFTERLLVEGKALDVPYRQIAAAAVIRNPWAGRGFVADLAPEVDAVAPELGRLLADECVAWLGGADRVACFGKAAVVGLAGELEHANALIHTVAFGNPIRAAIGGETWMVSSQKRAAAGCTLEVPVAHKTIDRNQASYHSVEVRVPDAPRDDEILVAVAMTGTIRPNARPHMGGAMTGAGAT